MKKPSRSKCIRLLITVMSLLTAASPGWALFGPGCQCGTIGSFHQSTRYHVSKEATEAARNIIEALQAHSRQQSSYLDRQVEAHKRLVDGEQQNHSMRLREEFRAEAESGKYDPNEDFCHLVDLSITRENNEGTNISPQVITKRVSDWSGGKQEIVKKNGVHLAAWLKQEKDAIGTIGEIEQPTTDWGVVSDQDTIPAEQPNVMAAINRLVANTVDPIPPIPLSPKRLQTPGGLSEAVIRDSIAARKQAASSLIEFSIGLSLPSESSEGYRPLAELSHYQAEIPDQISQLQALDIRTSIYFSPTVETLEIRHEKNERALLQDLIDLNSLNTRLNYLRLVQETRASVALAAILATLTDNGYGNLSSQ